MKEISIIDQFRGFLKTPDIFPETENTQFNTFKFPQVDINDSVKASLEELNHPRNSVLGKRMESFFEIAIENSSRYDLIASNIQIIEKKQTLGELDFLLYDRDRSQSLHVELVYKLYVYDNGFPKEIQRWIGPNRRDSFQEKMEKLEKRQFPLLYKPETINYLNKFGLNPDHIEQQLCFKVQLFTPEDWVQEDKKVVNPEGFIGNWYKLEDFLQKKWNANLFFCPKKKYWSCDPRSNSNWFSYSELQKEIEILFENKKAPLVWMKSGSEYYRFFIVWW